jgi:hypothetical protein
MTPATISESQSNLESSSSQVADSTQNSSSSSASFSCASAGVSRPNAIILAYSGDKAFAGSGVQRELGFSNNGGGFSLPSLAVLRMGQYTSFVDPKNLVKALWLPSRTWERGIASFVLHIEHTLGVFGRECLNVTIQPCPRLEGIHERWCAGSNPCKFQSPAVDTLFEEEVTSFAPAFLGRISRP